MEHRSRQWAAVMAVVVLAAVLRTYDLKDVPAGLYCDEAGLGYNAWTLATAGVDENGRAWPLYVWSFGTSYKNPVFIYAAMVPVKLLGLDEFSVRLTAALFGTGTVLAIFWLGRALFGPWVGLWAALFLALCPWHLHFSRIAFELISFPFLFVSGCVLLVRFAQGCRTLPAALFFFALCVYSYAIAALFVPLFLLGFGVLYLPTLLRRWRQTLLALLLVAAALAPAAAFFTSQTGTGTQYFRRTTFVDVNQPWRPQAERFVHNYRQFFSRQFLLERGDPLTRHSVRGFGELHPFYVPFLLLGAVGALLRRDRASKLLLWWVALYPIGPSLMNEIPSSSRGIIGVPVLCLLSGVGFGATLRFLGWVLRRRWLALAAQTAAVFASAAVLGPQVARYLHAYFVDYPTYSAISPGGFQYGYRDMIHYMESQRDKYDLLMMTATDVNQPQVFPQFYNRLLPGQGASWRNTGYLILKPEEFSRYSMDQRILYALDPRDMDLFSDYEVKKRIEAPGGQVAFLIVEVKARKRFLTGWLGLGLFADDDGTGINRDFVDPTRLQRGERYEGAFGEIGWRPIWQQFVDVDLNRFFATMDPRHPGNPERVCAYAATAVRSPTGRQAVLEIAGSLNDSIRVWLDGRPLTPWPLRMTVTPHYRPIELLEGNNLLLVQSCEDIGTWHFSARITDAEGRDLNDITTVPEIPSVTRLRTDPADMLVQLAEGFDGIIGAARKEGSYPDYRGGAQSWRASMNDHSAVTWRTAVCPAKKRTGVVFTASTSDEEGKFKLFVDGRYALTFDSFLYRQIRSWERDGFHLTFVSKAGAAGNSGFYLLAVPADRVTAGQSVELRVVPEGGDDRAWFMIKEHRDTLAHERITPAMAVEAIHGTWRTRPLEFVRAQ